MSKNKKTNYNYKNFIKIKIKNYNFILIKTLIRLNA